MPNIIFLFHQAVTTNYSTSLNRYGITGGSGTDRTAVHDARISNSSSSDTDEDTKEMYGKFICKRCR